MVVRTTAQLPPDVEWQVDNLDTGWSSGRMQLSSGAQIDLQLTKDGENHFKIFILRGAQGAILQSDAIVVTRTPVAIDGIPASHSIGVAVKERLSGSATRMNWLMRKGEPLPKKGREIFKAGEALRAGGPGGLVFRLYEGEIESPPEDNRPVGCLKVEGKDFATGIIQAGDDLVCDYEVADSGRVAISVSVPSVAASFSPGHDFYSRQEGLIDFTTAGQTVSEECASLRDRIELLAGKIDDDRLDSIRERIDSAESDALSSTDPEVCKQASETVLDARKTLSHVRRDHMEIVRETDLEKVIEWFEPVREAAKPAEATTFDTLARNARRVLSHRSSEFEQFHGEMWGIVRGVLWRQDWWVLRFFESLRSQPHRFHDVVAFRRLADAGEEAIRRDDIQQLRGVVAQLMQYRIDLGGDEDTLDPVNILK